MKAVTKTMSANVARTTICLAAGLNLKLSKWRGSEDSQIRRSLWGCASAACVGSSTVSPTTITTKSVHYVNRSKKHQMTPRTRWWGGTTKSSSIARSRAWQNNVSSALHVNWIPNTSIVIKSKPYSPHCLSTPTCLSSNQRFCCVKSAVNKLVPIRMK